MTEQEKYIEGQKASGIEVGDTVRVVRKWKSYENGCNTTFTQKKRDFGPSIVREIDSDGDVQLESDDRYKRYFPYFVLEIIKKADGTVPELIVTGKTEITGERNMSTQEQTVFDITIVERTEVLHKGSGVVEKINRDILFDDKVSAVGNIAAQQKALDKIKAALSPEATLDYDKLEITCKPF